ncbi:putative calcium-binding protein CML23 [Tetrabaena socialis]|uniref:Putative calcium-binding protein CML23 n=1 Tax=Tetrabaena socialis TaxID=47790 RepID=A0A2J8A9M7_9CHLO|nr:putative calcium-binding protein CML23 [Tetrabaena socialis]|eukprot:PNH09211.1 putative calcium-binding protein CML23 [Tetrabaena socialis]
MDRKRALLDVFALLDQNDNGYVELRELKTTATSPTAQGQLEEACETLSWLDLDGDRRVSPEEFVQVFTFMGADMDDRQFELFVEDMKVHTGEPVSRESLLKRVFQSLDRDRSGYIEMHELKTLVGRVAPAESLERARGTLRMFDTNEDGRVSMDEFLSVFEFLGQDLDDTEFHLATTVVMDKLSGRQPLVLLDVRSDEERVVSVMPGAVPVCLQPAPAATWGYALAGGAPAAAAVVREALALTTAAAMPAAQPPVVVAYCSTGELGGVAALLLSEALKVTVYNMCGGIINYYNQGGSVARLSDGKQVQALHPGGQQQRAFVTRPNNYR